MTETSSQIMFCVVCKQKTEHKHYAYLGWSCFPCLRRGVTRLTAPNEEYEASYDRWRGDLEREMERELDVSYISDGTSNHATEP